MNVTYQTKILLAIAAVADADGCSAEAITIAAAKLEPLGSFVTIEDIVVSNTIDLVNSVNSANLHAQDATDGITIFGSTGEIGAIFAGVTAGDRIHVSGTTTTFAGLFEIQGPLIVQLAAAGVGVPAPTVTTTGDFQDFSADGRRSGEPARRAEERAVHKHPAGANVCRRHELHSDRRREQCFGPCSARRPSRSSGT